MAFAKQATFPVVVKNSEPWVRRRVPVVTGTTVVRESSELLALARTPAPELSLLLQEYIPPADAEDWIVHLYSGPDHGCLVVFTGLKIRSWPPNAGQTACAYSVRNPALARIATRFCNQIGFRGVADLDWRLDRRDGRYKLVDFNPRVGNQFRLFETDTGVDVVRALHLDLTGRSVPTGEQVYGRRFLLEHADPLARLADRRSTRSRHLPRPQPRATELAWAARDDPLPFVAMWPRLAMPLASYLVHCTGQAAAGGNYQAFHMERAVWPGLVPPGPSSSSRPGPAGCRPRLTRRPAAGGCGASAREGDMQICVVPPGELGPGEIAAWHAMQRSTESLANPFLSPEFVIAVGHVRPEARVAILADGTSVAGFFPFERRMARPWRPHCAGPDGLPGPNPRPRRGMGPPATAPGVSHLCLAVRPPGRRPASVSAYRSAKRPLAGDRPR